MLYIMRYGKTDWNVQHKLQGRIDIPNNEKYMKNVQNTYVKLFLYATTIQQLLVGKNGEKYEYIVFFTTKVQGSIYLQ